MNSKELFRMSGANLVRRKGRTLLTTMGVVIGVGALVLMVSLGIGLKLQFTKMFESEDLLRTITVTRVEGANSKRPRLGTFGPVGETLPLTDNDLAEIRRIAGDALVYPDVMFALDAKVPLSHPIDEKNELSAQFVLIGGVPAEEDGHYASMLIKGRLWKPGERACLVPSGLLEGRFGLKVEDIALEKTIAFHGKKKKAPPQELLEYKIAGILDGEKLGLKGRQVFLPMDQALELRKATEGGFSFIPYEEGTYPAAEVKLRDARRVNEVKTRLKSSGYEALATTDVLDVINTVFLVVEGFLACIGAVGLLVALFGIANTMAMSVLERTREIGIIKALGARNRDIRRLFLLEAAWIGAAGGIVGLAGGWALGLIANAIARRLMDMPAETSFFHVSIWLVAGSIGFSILVSVVAGVLPAVRASRMDPVQALRYE